MPKNLLNYTFWAALELNNDTHPSGKKIQLFNQIFFHFTHLNKEHNQAWIYFHCLYAFIADKPPMLLWCITRTMSRVSAFTSKSDLKVF